MSAEDHAEAHGLSELAIIRAAALGGVVPRVMGIGPVPAVTAALKRADLCVSDRVGLSARDRQPQWRRHRTWSHPVGASGAIILIKLIFELRRIGRRFGFATMCIGGGQGIAVIIENPKAAK